MSYNKQYFMALQKIIETGYNVTSREMVHREILDHTFRINPDDNIITIPFFETNIEYAKAELEWYLAGTDKISFSPIIEKTWKKFSDNGITVNSAYGIRIFGKHPIIGINQWNWCLKELRDDPGSRRAVININSYIDKRVYTKDFPCTMYIHLFIRDNKLIWITRMRSQDIFYGTRNDIYCFTEMMKLMAKQLGIAPGMYFHCADSLHLYHKHLDKYDSMMLVSRDLYEI